MSNPALFARVGWMRFYQGVQDNDPKPRGGGAYNQEHVGHEVYNFKLFSGKYYGHFQPPKGGATGYGNRIDLARIVGKTDKSRLDGVTVVFVSRPKKGAEQVVVGWYTNATVFGKRQESKLSEREEIGFMAVATGGEAVLLPTRDRTWTVPWGKGGMGQANVCYPLKPDGSPKDLPWWGSILKKIRAYDGPNLLDNELLEQAEYVASISGGQGFGLNVAERKAVEMHAMAMAEKYFTEMGFTVEDTHTTKPYDLLCRKGRKTLYLEVKGSTGTAESIFLTRNEVTLAKDPEFHCALFIVSEVRLSHGENAIKPSGGKRRVIDPWKPRSDFLEALQYSYNLSKHLKQAKS